jgi:hypothetical protein
LKTVQTPSLTKVEAILLGIYLKNKIELATPIAFYIPYSFQLKSPVIPLTAAVIKSETPSVTNTKPHILKVVALNRIPPTI